MIKVGKMVRNYLWGILNAIMLNPVPQGRLVSTIFRSFWYQAHMKVRSPLFELVYPEPYSINHRCEDNPVVLIEPEALAVSDPPRRQAFCRHHGFYPVLLCIPLYSRFSRTRFAPTTGAPTTLRRKHWPSFRIPGPPLRPEPRRRKACVLVYHEMAKLMSKRASPSGLSGRTCAAARVQDYDWADISPTRDRVDIGCAEIVGFDPYSPVGKVAFRIESFIGFNGFPRTQLVGECIPLLPWPRTFGRGKTRGFKSRELVLFRFTFRFSPEKFQQFEDYIGRQYMPCHSGRGQVNWFSLLFARCLMHAGLIEPRHESFESFLGHA